MKPSRSEFIRGTVKGIGVAALLASVPPAVRAQQSAPAVAGKPYDLREFCNWLVNDFEPSARLPGGAGHYARKPGETVMEVYGTTDMACIFYALGKLNLTEKQRSEWIEAIQSFQNPDTGYLVEKDPTHDKLHNTAFSLAALNLLSAGAKYPLKFAAEYKDPWAFLSTLDWEKNVYTESHKGAGVGAIYALAPELHDPKWFAEYFAFCDSLFDPNNGMMGKNKPASGDSDQIGGTFHYAFLYNHFNRRIPYPEKRIDSIIALQQPDGYWRADKSPWLTLDALYLMTRSVRQQPYRVEDVRRVVRKTMDVLMVDLYSPEGRAKAFSPRITVHSATAAISIAAELQQFLGADQVITDWPLKLVLDRRPFI
jgi:hypothetical protein